jgi:hypothetical protein
MTSAIGGEGALVNQKAVERSLKAGDFALVNQQDNR